MNDNYIYCCFIEGHKRYGDHIKVGYSRHPWTRYDHDKNIRRYSIIRAVPIGMTTQIEALAIEKRMIQIIDTFMQNRCGKLTSERYVLENGSGSAIIERFNWLAEELLHGYFK